MAASRTAIQRLLEENSRGARKRYARVRNKVLAGLGRLRVRYISSVYSIEELAEKLARDARIPEDETLRTVVKLNIDHHGLDTVQQPLAVALGTLCAKHRFGAADRLLRASMAVIAERNPARAIELGESFIEDCPRPRVAGALMKLHSREGNITSANVLLETYLEGEKKTPLMEKVSAEAQLLSLGMPIYMRKTPVCVPEHNRKILYHVSQCPPHHNSGYAIRTHSLAEHLVDKGWDIEVFARHGYPNDRYDFLDRDLVPERENVAPLQYHFVPERDGFRTLTPQRYQERAVETLCKQALEFRPALIHTASNQIVGLAGTEAAKRLGIPSIYEMRGLWHMTRASKQPSYAATEHYAMTHALEMQAAQQADHVLAITEAIRDIVIEAGIPENKITVVPNAVDTSAFQPQEPDEAMKKELGYGDETVIGFVGSFAAYEGLDYLLRAAAKLRDDGHDGFRLLLVGDGEAMDGLRALARELGIDSLVTFTGRVPHAQVSRYYSLMQICAYPRKGLQVCEVVSPLKPYEAMAMEKAVVVSSVQALAEMVQPDDTGLVHEKDDWESLATSLATLLASPELPARLGRNARKWVQEHRTWEAVTKRVESVYEALID